MIGVRGAAIVRVASNRQEHLAGADRPELDPKCGGSCFFVGRTGTSILKDKRRKGDLTFHPVVETFLLSHPDGLTPALGDDQWRVRTECSLIPENSRGTGIPVIVRCHPNYNNSGPWHDWVVARFNLTEAGVEVEPDRGEVDSIHNDGHQFEWGCVPCKVLAFVEDSDGTTKAVVHPCSLQTNDDWLDSTSLTETHRLRYEQIPNLQPQEAIWCRPGLVVIELESIVCRLLVVEENPGVHSQVNTGDAALSGQDRVIVVRPRNKWGKRFS